MGDRFTDEATRLAVQGLEEDLITAGRQWEDAERAGDAHSAAWALQQYNETQMKYDRMVGADKPPQQGLSEAQKQFISRRVQGGEDLRGREQDYFLAHARAVNAGLEIDSPQYFAAVSASLDNGGDGRQRPLDEREAARLCGLTDQEYAAGAQHVRGLKRAGYYQQD